MLLPSDSNQNDRNSKQACFLVVYAKLSGISSQDTAAYYYYCYTTAKPKELISKFIQRAVEELFIGVIPLLAAPVPIAVRKKVDEASGAG